MVYFLMFHLVAATKNSLVFTRLAKHRARVKTSRCHREGTIGGERNLVY